MKIYYIFVVFFSTAQHTVFANVPNYGSFADQLVDSLGCGRGKIMWILCGNIGMWTRHWAVFLDRGCFNRCIAGRMYIEFGGIIVFFLCQDIA